MARNRVPDLHQIRAAEPGDTAACAALARAAYRRYVAEIGFEPPPMRQDFHVAIRLGRVQVAGDPPVGYIVAYPKAGDWHIENVATAPQAQGSGLGRRLIEASEATARVRGFARVTLYTNAAMVPNLTLYPHLGYRQTDRRVEEGLDRVFFEKSL